MKLIKTLITTYQSFTTTHDLLNKLMERYEVPEEHADIRLPIQLRVCNIMRFWVTHYVDDFDTRDIKTLSDFVETKLTQNPTYEKYAKKIQNMISKVLPLPPSYALCP